MGEYNKYKGGMTIGSGLTYTPTGRFPVIGGTVYETYQDLLDYISSPTSTAIGGAILFVVADLNLENNGAYEIIFRDPTLKNSDGSIKIFNNNGECNLIANKLHGTSVIDPEDPSTPTQDLYTTKCEIVKTDNITKLVYTLSNGQEYSVDISELTNYQITSSSQDTDLVKIDITTNEETKTQEINTIVKTVSLFNEDLSNDNNGLATAYDIQQYIKWYVSKNGGDTEHPDADISYIESTDELIVNKEGTIGKDDIKAIEEYIDNGNMGTY